MPKPNLIRYQEMSQYEQWLLKARVLQRYEDKCDRYEALLYRNVLHNDRMMMEIVIFDCYDYEHSYLYSDPATGERLFLVGDLCRVYCEPTDTDEQCAALVADEMQQRNPNWRECQFFNTSIDTCVSLGRAKDLNQLLCLTDPVIYDNHSVLLPL